MADPFIGEIRPFPYNFAPRGWAVCDGQLLPISQYTALFSILGARYGGNGVTTFGLPNLSGRVAVGAGQGDGLTPRSLGSMGGEEAVALTEAELPTHTHEMQAATSRGSVPGPQPDAIFNLSSGADVYSAAAPTAPMWNLSLGPATGGGQPHSNLMPFTAVTFCIALEGEFPPRQ